MCWLVNHSALRDQGSNPCGGYNFEAPSINFICQLYRKNWISKPDPIDSKSNLKLKLFYPPCHHLAVLGQYFQTFCFFKKEARPVLKKPENNFLLLLLSNYGRRFWRTQLLFWRTQLRHFWRSKVCPSQWSWSVMHVCSCRIFGKHKTQVQAWV